MSIDYLDDLSRAVESGKIIFACPAAGRNQWAISKEVGDLEKVAQRAAAQSKMACCIYRVIPAGDAISGDLFLVPVEIGDPGVRGEPNIKWKTVDTKDAAEMMKDVRKGPSPVFGIQLEQSVEPTA